jgi:hypothetical protein
MSYRNLFLIFLYLIFTNCTTDNLRKNQPNYSIVNNYSNKGFALIYNENLYNNKVVSKKIGERELIIFQRNLKKNSQVKITNILNNKSLIVNVGGESDYPSFNNSVVSLRIANELNINIDEPYVEIIALSKNSLFVAKKAKTYDEEKKVANKVPVNSISIDDLNIKKTEIKKNLNRKFSYILKIGDFYFKDTASSMIKRIKNETNIEKPNIKKISNKIYRVYLGPFDTIISLQKSYNDISILEFENIEIIKND